MPFRNWKPSWKARGSCPTEYPVDCRAALHPCLAQTTPSTAVRRHLPVSITAFEPAPGRFHAGIAGKQRGSRVMTHRILQRCRKRWRDEKMLFLELKSVID